MEKKGQSRQLSNGFGLMCRKKGKRKKKGKGKKRKKRKREVIMN